MWGVDWLQFWAFMQTVGGPLLALALMLLIVLVVLVDVYVVQTLRRWLARRRSR